MHGGASISAAAALGSGARAQAALGAASSRLGGIGSGVKLNNGSGMA